MATILVTGGAGFIGSHVAKNLIEKDHDVVIIDDLSRGFKRNISKEATFLKGDLTDETFVKETFNNHTFDYVIHVAAYSAVGFSHITKKVTAENNTLASINLINESVNHKIKCFVFVSSISVYDPAGKKPFTEDSLDLKPAEPYGLTKLTTENELRITAEKFGLNYVIVRPFNVYGEKQHIGDANRNVVGIFIRKALRKEPLTIIGSGNNTMAFTHIDDLAPIIATLPFNEAAYQETFNIGADKQNSLNDLAKTIQNLANNTVEITRSEQKVEQEDLVASIEKAKQLLEYEPKISFEEGLERMWRWAKTLEEIKDASVTKREITNT